MDQSAPLRRTPTSNSDNALDDTASLTAVQSGASSATSSRPHFPNGRSPSTHSLLSAHKNPDVRKAARPETTKASADRSSISMPPPMSKPLPERRLSTSLNSLRSQRRSQDDARSPPASVKSLDGDRAIFGASPTAQTSTTGYDPTVVTTASSSKAPGLPLLSAPDFNPSIPNQSDIVSTLHSQVTSASSATKSDTSIPAGQTIGSIPRPDISETILPNRVPRVPKPRSISSSRRLSTTGASRNDAASIESKPSMGRIGVCALDVKARSRPSRQILTRLQGDGDFEVIVFGDKAILDEDVENWPICDFLISFFSDGFPLDKAIAYVKLRKPFVVNDLPMQKVLWDRRLCLKILDHMQIPTPRRIEVNRDGGPRLESPELAQHVYNMTGVVLEGPEDGTGGGTPITKMVELTDEGDTIVVDGKSLKKPFVEKPVNGEDHNVIIYFPKSQDGGARRLFRKIGNKSSEYDPNLNVPRSITEPNSSYIYEQFLRTENAEDVKAYTVGPDYCHAETRKSPVVDGLVRRNTHGKELRYVTKLNDAERDIAAKVARAFGQRICGFDMLRTGNASYIIDVNGWSFVKDNEDYYNDCANILRGMFVSEKFKQENGMLDELPTETTDDLPGRRQGTGHSHRSALKTILKSPSMTKLSQHLPHSSRHHSATGAASPKSSTMTTPLTSPPSLDRHLNALVMPNAAENLESLPPPIVNTAPTSATENESLPSAREQEAPAPMPSSKHSWKLKGFVTVVRHADRTPKQKIKFTAHSQVFADLLKGHHEEVLLKGEAALASVEAAVKIAQRDHLEDPDKLHNLRIALAKKGSQPGTKVQIKPMFRKRRPEEMSNNTTDGAHPSSPSVLSISETEPFQISESPLAERSRSISETRDADKLRRLQTRSDSISGATFSRFSAAENDLVLDKLQLVMKWGGEPTHSARYQSQDLGANMRDDFKLLNREVFDDVRIFTSSEKRVKTSAQIWAAAFLDRQDIAEDFIQVRKDLLDDSNAAKDVMDKVKKKLKHLLREGSVPEAFAWPKDVASPFVVMHNVIDLLKFHRRVMRHNFKKLATGATASLAALNGSPDSKDTNKDVVTVASIQSRWCTGEDAELFKERWEKLFTEFCDTEKADPSKISELYDTMKYDALHNKQFLEWVFTPSQSLLDEMGREEGLALSASPPESEHVEGSVSPVNKSRQESIISAAGSLTDKHSFAQKIGLRRQSVLKQPVPAPPLYSWEQGASYFKLFSGPPETKSSLDQRLGRLRELYRYSKILFDYIGPQEYGISDEEKLEIGLLTSLPLLREIVDDLEELQASGDAKSFIYFTKESHIYTLLNCIMEGGIHTKIKRSTIPELDYLSQICFELYEAKDADTAESTYSIRISISPGCHTIDPLDVSLDSKHAIGSAPRRSLTNHQDWKEVISTLKAKFNTVQLPKSFLAVNVSEKHEQEAERRASYLQSEAVKHRHEHEHKHGEEWDGEWVVDDLENEDPSGGGGGGVQDVNNTADTEPLSPRDVAATDSITTTKEEQ
ncbi:inositol hexakisphosphate and diphosphoinositol-pentakisphosphate kinase [Exophiala xenobiotica]|uniref:Inositol hexakisphosphate and diphosphoinositol-pentakisphosphate kinase n=1 Tax=Vermiconidia calcicola TaxID=1690605 RepID=A0AAV9QP01_9PEZI|nr:inositol hexakisphosphate and diphosphoinositol-pentakisphosphate kinase [Exophiala xenobiotica]KAK5545729.1 inositol hexakisphosphate and diphosphoinositol-pentakisphosphate kinase [Vermiconidia calcicola]KAK5550011.1 inositol hexakisphosphate and diphosphoinositol-pentakisphosphate kinase [Chaetothyriales sp. CCFEE 6169]KAK5229889.1 inositol hexakisphosphate and diphosphoinositol-pentakisphosphate kinase [Exophiala xenobiotica]KAK5271676.1 inositol hexakisphosphate and diphosphoinositol-pe